MILHIILKNTVEGGEHEEIMIEGVGNVRIDEGYIIIFSDAIMELHPNMGKFFLSEIVGWWFEQD